MSDTILKILDEPFDDQLTETERREIEAQRNQVGSAQIDRAERLRDDISAAISLLEENGYTVVESWKGRVLCEY